ncbi:MAG: ribosome silencing factor [Endomicrobiaceae bacterium]|nr:ribosome silencing factor [Endomicrobiaceae bacterium]
MVKIDFLELAKQAQKIAEDKKGEDVIVIDVTGKTAIANYFLIITATSTPQINAISNEIEKTLKYDFDVPPVRREGRSSPTWKVIDFGGLLVHIMTPDVRAQYNLEKIWNTPDEKTKKEKIKKVYIKKFVAKKKVVKKKVSVKKIASKKKVIKNKSKK